LSSVQQRYEAKKRGELVTCRHGFMMSLLHWFIIQTNTTPEHCTLIYLLFYNMFWLKHV